MIQNDRKFEDGLRQLHGAKTHKTQVARCGGTMGHVHRRWGLEHMNLVRRRQRWLSRESGELKRVMPDPQRGWVRILLLERGRLRRRRIP